MPHHRLPALAFTSWPRACTSQLELNALHLPFVVLLERAELPLQLDQLAFSRLELPLKTLQGAFWNGSSHRCCAGIRHFPPRGGFVAVFLALTLVELVLRAERSEHALRAVRSEAARPMSYVVGKHPEKIT